ncbi:MAG: hypothetical protein E7213_00020 [Clostridium sp.]|nr:hypothetical protein [Clostridium sp.]
MQKTRNFGETLKLLKNISGMKTITLANYLGYDISYISKWCANKNLPSGRNVVHIFEELSRIFSREIYNTNSFDKFNKEFETEFSNKTELKEYLKVILEDSYDRTKKNEKIIKKNYNKIIFGKDEIEDFINNMLSELLSVGGKELEIYCTLDILNSEKFFSEKNIISQNSKINLKIGCDVSRFSKRELRDVYNIHNILRKVESCDIKVYSDEDFKKANILLVKNEFALMYSLDKEEKPDFCAVITEQDELDKIYASIGYRFKASNIIVDTISEEELMDKQYIFNFYNSKNFNFLFDLDFDFLDPKSMLEKISIKDNAEVLNNQISNLQTIVQKKLKNSKVDIFVEKNTLNNYIYNNVLLYGNKKASNVLNRIENLVEYIKSNDKMKIYIIEKASIYEVYKDNLSVYLGENFMLMKKTKNSNCSKDDLYYIVKSENILKDMFKICEEIKNTKSIREITVQELTSFLEEYRYLL